MIVQVASLVSSVGWALVWLLALILAVVQILRGRPLAGAALGLACVGGFLTRMIPTVMGFVTPILTSAAGLSVAVAAARLVDGLADAAILVLLLLGVALQRPPREPEPAEG